MSRAFPSWNGPMLVGFQAPQSSRPLIYAVDRTGRREEIWVEPPDTQLTTLNAVTAGFDRAIAIAASGYSGDDRFAAFIIWISPDRSRRTVIRTWPYAAYRIALAADGTIWAAGKLIDQEHTRVVAYNVLRRFDPSGTLLKSITVNAKPRKSDRDAVMTSYLAASKDRLGWLTNGCQYIEFDLTGGEIARYDGPTACRWDLIRGAGLSSDNDFAFGIRGDKGFSLAELNRATHQWSIEALASPSASRGDAPYRVLGFDDTALVLLDGNHMAKRFDKTADLKK